MVKLLDKPREVVVLATQELNTRASKSTNNERLQLQYYALGAMMESGAGTARYVNKQEYEASLDKRKSTAKSKF